MLQIEDYEVRLIFDKNGNSFVAGETLSGQIKYRMKTPRTLDFLMVSLLGIMECNWKTEKPRERDSFIHFIKNIMLVECGKKRLLETGINGINFSYKLPENLPPTFKGEHGTNEYTISVHSGLKGEYFVDEFEINGFLDLNEICEAKQPFNIVDTYMATCFGRKAQKIWIQVACSRSGYIPGEITTFRIDINNNSNNDIKKTIIELYKNVDFIVEGLKEQMNVKVILTRNVGSIIKKRTTQSLSLSLFIPKTEPSTLRTDLIIQIRYYIQVTCKLSNCFPPLIESHPVYIGTIPIKKH